MANLDPLSRPKPYQHISDKMGDFYMDEVELHDYLAENGMSLSSEGFVLNAAGRRKYTEQFPSLEQLFEYIPVLLSQYPDLLAYLSDALNRCREVARKTRIQAGHQRVGEVHRYFSNVVSVMEHTIVRMELMHNRLRDHRDLLFQYQKRLKTMFDFFAARAAGDLDKRPTIVRFDTETLDIHDPSTIYYSLNIISDFMDHRFLDVFNEFGDACNMVWDLEEILYKWDSMFYPLTKGINHYTILRMTVEHWLNPDDRALNHKWILMSNQLLRLGEAEKDANGAWVDEDEAERIRRIKEYWYHQSELPQSLIDDMDEMLRERGDTL